MSYPRLILEQSGLGSTNTAITNIELVYDSPVGSNRPTRLIMDSYRVQREIRAKNVSQQVPNRYQNLYDQYRTNHSWIGYCDVLSESITTYQGAPTTQDKTVNLLNQAILYNPGTGGIEYVVGLPSTLGQGNPSNDFTLVERVEPPVEFAYKVVDNVEVSVPYWIIKDIDVRSNNNGTSRVTFSFFGSSGWLTMASAID